MPTDVCAQALRRFVRAKKKLFQIDNTFRDRLFPDFYPNKINAAAEGSVWRPDLLIFEFCDASTVDVEYLEIAPTISENPH